VSLCHCVNPTFLIGQAGSRRPGENGKALVFVRTKSTKITKGRRRRRRPPSSGRSGSTALGSARGAVDRLAPWCPWCALCEPNPSRRGARRRSRSELTSEPAPIAENIGDQYRGNYKATKKQFNRRAQSALSSRHPHQPIVDGLQRMGGTTISGLCAFV
jgi:hypothetical protein